MLCKLFSICRYNQTGKNINHIPQQTITITPITPIVTYPITKTEPIDIPKKKLIFKQ